MSLITAEYCDVTGYSVNVKLNFIYFCLWFQIVHNSHLMLSGHLCLTIEHGH